jgi:hypothetical protein
MRYMRSQATQATWSFVIDDHASGATLLVDGRPRFTGCNRAGRELRCELFGMFPGGHTIEVRLPGAVMRRSTVIGRPWPARPALVRVRTPEEAQAAAQAGADGVIASAELGVELLQDIADAAHAKSARMFVASDSTMVERAGADGVIDGPLEEDVKRRFPEALALLRDLEASTLAAAWKPGALPDAARLGAASGMVEAPGLVGGALALLSPRGAIVDKAAFPLLGPRRRHDALRTGAHAITVAEPARLGFTLSHRGATLAVLVNAGGEPWKLRPPAPANPLDLLGSHVENEEVTIAPQDVALLITTPARDKTRF